MKCRECGTRFYAVIKEDEDTDQECPKCRKKNIVLERSNFRQKTKLKIERFRRREKELRRFSNQNTSKKLIIDFLIINLCCCFIPLNFYWIVFRISIFFPLIIVLLIYLINTIVVLGVGRFILTYEYQSGINPLIFLILGILILPFVKFDFLVQLLRIIVKSIQSRRNVENY